MVTITATVATQPSAQNVNSLEEQNDSDTPLAPPEFEEPPDGGIQAWLVAAGGGAIYLPAWASPIRTGPSRNITSHTIYRLVLQTMFLGLGRSPSSCSLPSLALVAGPMFDRFGAKVKTIHNFQKTKLAFP